jgi:UDP-N-acetylmuramoyl-tripeptide--D-alanyl-D-alanine ligase
MKYLIKKIVIGILTIEAFLVLKRFKPKIIAVTGSVGKTSTKDAIFGALSQNLHIRKDSKSFNSEIGVPLSILGLPNGYLSFKLWFQNLVDGFLAIFSGNYPDWLVLEFGVDRPGDMEFLVKWIKLDIAVLTRFPDVPVHVEYFESPLEIINEKKKILKSLKPNGVVVLNADDSKIMEIKDKIKSKVLTFGITNEADVRASNQETILDDGGVPMGINFKVDYKENSVPVSIKGVLGKQHVYPALAAICCGISQDISIVDMTSALSDFGVAPGRMRILDGVDDSIIIDDSYNASPVSVQEAVKVLGDIASKGLKIAVLGDMTEIGRYTANEHRIIGKMVHDLGINYLFTMGKRAEFIADEAVASRMAKSKVFSFSDHNELEKKLREFIEPGTTVLVKGSQSMRMEKVVEEIMQKKDEAKKLLVRQDQFWKEK